VFTWQEWLVSAFKTAEFDRRLQFVIASNFVTQLEGENHFAAQRYAVEVLSYAVEKQGQTIDMAASPGWIINGSLSEELR
jgi:hypothetical protein